MEITLDKRYEVSEAPAKTTAKTGVKATAEEKPDENGWTQSQQKALER